jgi:hypothetical protein
MQSEPSHPAQSLQKIIESNPVALSQGFEPKFVQGNPTLDFPGYTCLTAINKSIQSKPFCHPGRREFPSKWKLTHDHILLKEVV